MWLLDQGSKMVFWGLLILFCLKLAWIPLQRFVPKSLAAEPVPVTEVVRAGKGSTRTTILVKTR